MTSKKASKAEELKKQREMREHDEWRRRVVKVTDELVEMVELVKDKDSDADLGMRYTVLIEGKELGEVRGPGRDDRRIWNFRMNRSALPEDAGYQRTMFGGYTRREAVKSVVSHYVSKSGLADEKRQKDEPVKKATRVKPPAPLAEAETFKVLVDKVEERDGFTFRIRVVSKAKTVAWRVIVDDKKVVGRKRTVNGHRLVAEGVAPSQEVAERVVNDNIAAWLDKVGKYTPKVGAGDVDDKPKAVRKADKPKAAGPSGARTKRYIEWDTLEAIDIVGSAIAQDIVRTDEAADKVEYPDWVAPSQAQMLEYRFSVAFDAEVAAGRKVLAARQKALKAGKDETKVKLDHPLSLGQWVTTDIQAMLDEERRNGTKYWNKMKRKAAASLKAVGHDLGAHRA